MVNAPENLGSLAYYHPVRMATPPLPKRSRAVKTIAIVHTRYGESPTIHLVSTFEAIRIVFKVYGINWKYMSKPFQDMLKLIKGGKHAETMTPNGTRLTIKMDHL